MDFDSCRKDQMNISPVEPEGSESYRENIPTSILSTSRMKEKPAIVVYAHYQDNRNSSLKRASPNHYHKKGENVQWWFKNSEHSQRTVHKETRTIILEIWNSVDACPRANTPTRERS